MVFRLTLDQFARCVSHHNSRCKQSVPRSPLLSALGFDFNFVHYKQFACFLFNKHVKTKTWPGKAKFFAYVNSRKERAARRKKLQSNVSQKKRSPQAKIQAFSQQFFFSPKSSLSLVLHSPLQLIVLTNHNIINLYWQSVNKLCGYTHIELISKHSQVFPLVKTETETLTQSFLFL